MSVRYVTTHTSIARSKPDGPTISYLPMRVARNLKPMWTRLIKNETQNLTFRWSNCELCSSVGLMPGYNVTSTPMSLISTTLALYTAPNSRSGVRSVDSHVSMRALASSIAACDGANTLYFVSSIGVICGLEVGVGCKICKNVFVNLKWVWDEKSSRHRLC